MPMCSYLRCQRETDDPSGRCSLHRKPDAGRIRIDQVDETTARISGLYPGCAAEVEVAMEEYLKTKPWEKK
jgi:hypothetical protein